MTFAEARYEISSRGFYVNEILTLCGLSENYLYRGKADEEISVPEYVLAIILEALDFKTEQRRLEIAFRNWAICQRDNGRRYTWAERSKRKNDTATRSREIISETYTRRVEERAGIWQQINAEDYSTERLGGIEYEDAQQIAKRYGACYGNEAN